MPLRSIFQYALGAGIVFVMFGIGQTYITNIIGVLYPAFMSFIALETDGLDDDKQWLTYWVCFGVFNIFETFAGIILRFIPFYYFLKVGFLVYLFHPNTLGANWVYKNVIVPHMADYEKRLDDVQNKLKEGFKEGQKLVGGKSD